MIVEGIVLYKAEDNKLFISRRLRTLEMDAFRISCRISKLQRVLNTAVREKMNTSEWRNHRQSGARRMVTSEECQKNEEFGE